jgi:hypothetical protein
MSFRKAFAVVCTFFDRVHAARCEGSAGWGHDSRDGGGPGQRRDSGGDCDAYAGIGQGADHAIAERWNVCAARSSAGTYSMTVTMPGFATFVKLGMRIAAGQALTQDVKMAIEEQTQTVQVTASAAQVGVDPENNASSTTIKGKDLDALSDDPDELSSELTALAGPAAGPNGGQIYVDGFTGGQLPPKSSIREIRINQNPFSAQYDKLGYGRVEVFTKPGTDKFHGQFNLQGLDNALNTGNPLLNAFNTPGQPLQTQPPYHTIFVLGNLTGPLTKYAHRLRCRVRIARSRTTAW